MARNKMVRPTNWYLQVTAMYKGRDHNSHLHNSILAHCWLFYLLPILMYNICLLKYELPFLVLLWFLVVHLALPHERLTTIKALDIGDHVKPPHELNVLLHPSRNIHGPRDSQKIKGDSISIYPPDTMKIEM